MPATKEVHPKRRPSARAKAQRRPPCECSHTRPWGRAPCGEPAEFLVSLRCSVEGCDEPTAEFLLCGDCVETWRDLERRDFGVSTLVAVRLPSSAR